MEYHYLKKTKNNGFFFYVAYSRHNNKAWSYFKEIGGKEYANSFYNQRDYWHLRPDK